MASLPQRTVQRIGESPLAERIARVQELAYAPLIDRVRRSPLHSDVLGHPLHPPLTGATLLAGAGLLASLPTALAGAADGAELSGAERRVVAVHALGADVATFLFVGSLTARLRGEHGRGARLAAAGNVVMVGAGFLGGHLALRRRC
ncbi:hypothetical protein [Pimelobacter simplex]|uniref:hypothetical protein n=1 Tax=Nocardioides simplex TaxID=2045 RepID=UPI003AB07F56